ncbi:MAG TPA: PPOX class F420-dependent oxidoreductase [Verrucomicrobiae bacterium]|jgi:PPOX class probable F420-dependent enzyme|nr:PPOX class F420-dependent oxidoreductase [Verrucomicrobiae bacterium]
MSAKIPEEYMDLFKKKAFASFTTLMADGSPQTTPVWVDFVDGKLLVNSALGRQKDKNVRREPRVAVTLMDPDNPYRYLEVRGRISEITHEGADKHIDKMAKKYLDKDKYPFAQPGEKRVIYKIDPVHVSPHG